MSRAISLLSPQILTSNDMAAHGPFSGVVLLRCAAFVSPVHPPRATGPESRFHTSIAAARSSSAVPTDLNKVMWASDVRPLAVPPHSSNRSPRTWVGLTKPRLTGWMMSPASLPAPARVST